ncbi:MAG: PAS domain-containing protein [Gammaproteobacteria bacterium]|nr:PAS domain-containing protein [Gammaproteobacteria bacterium]
MTPNHHRSQALADAFEAFNQRSLQLEQSYRELEQRVMQLNTELAAARSERLQQLAEKECLADRLQTLIETLPAGVLVLDAAEYVRECNRVALEQLGKPLVGEHWSTIGARAFCVQDSFGAEIALHDGRRLNIASRKFDSAPGRILVLQDVTETHALQERLNRQQRLSAMGEMAASLAHQIRTPLSAAVLYSSHLGKEQLHAGDRARFAARLSERLGHLERLINDMLAFARGGQGGDAQFTVQGLLTALQRAVEPQMQVAGAQWRVSDAIPDAPLLGNQDALIGALSNLVNNSLQAKPKDAVLELRTVVNGSGEIEVRLRDNGPGIPAEARARIFDPFFTTRPGGTGLGLAVVQATLRAHHGSVRLETPATGGCEFVLCLPTALSAAELPSGERLNYLTTAAVPRPAVYGIN